MKDLLEPDQEGMKANVDVFDKFKAQFFDGKNYDQGGDKPNSVKGQRKRPEKPKVVREAIILEDSDEMRVEETKDEPRQSRKRTREQADLPNPEQLKAVRLEGSELERRIVTLFQSKKINTAGKNELAAFVKEKSLGDGKGLKAMLVEQVTDYLIS